MKLTQITNSFLLLALTAGCSTQPSGEKPKAEYSPQTGRLQRLTFDANRNGRNESVSVMDGTRILRIELDLDENGKVERWDFYGPDRKIEKVGFASRNDGVLDSQAFYSADGALQRMEISTRRDGRFDRVEFYDSGVLVRSEEDQNGDGRPDKWETYRPEPAAASGEPKYAITSVAFDDEGRGTPQRRFVYGTNGQIARVEVDPESDGTFVVRSEVQARTR